MSATAPPPPANRAELARVLRCSLPTVSALIERYPDLPVLRRGGRGIEWQFDAPAVVAFLQARRAEEAASKAAKSELLAQIALPLDDPQPSQDGTPTAPTLTPAERLAAARAAKAEDELARQRGFLVDLHQVRGPAQAMLALLAQTLAAEPQRLAARYNLPDAVRRDIAAELRATQRRLHEALDTLLLPAGDCAQLRDLAEALQADPNPKTRDLARRVTRLFPPDPTEDAPPAA